MPDRNVKVPYKTQLEQDHDVFVGQVMTIKNQARRIEKLERSQKKSNELITNLQADRNILKTENEQLKNTIRMLMIGDPQHA